MLAKNERNKSPTNPIAFPSHGGGQFAFTTRDRIAVNANPAKLVPIKIRKQTQTPNMIGFRKITYSVWYSL
jgi:hypothetical protein